MADEELDRFLGPELLEQLGDAVTVIDADWRYQFVSARAAAAIGRPVEELVGRYVWDIFPEVVGTPQHEAALRAMSQRSRERIVWYFAAIDSWCEQHALPVADGLVVLVNDITEHQLAVHRSEQLVIIGAALARATTFEEVNATLVEQAFPLVGAAGGSILVADETRGVMRAVGWAGMDDRLVREWGEYPLDRAAPGTQAYQTGEPVFVSDIAAQTERYPEAAAELLRLGRHTLAALPLTSAGVRLGTLVVNFATRRALSVGDEQFLTTTAAMAAQALLRARLLAAERQIIAALQRSLLPTALPVVPGLDIAVRYAASNTTAEVGGDWYDVIGLPAGAVGLVMGDVEGHDLRAAALMGLVRSATRAYAREGHPPAIVMERTNAFLSELALDRIVTVAYAQLHPVERLVTTVSAGHPGTQVATSDGSGFEVPAEVGPPLGIFDSGLWWPETTSVLPANCVFATFTDGLVERRGADITDGIEQVRATMVANESAGVDVLADALLASRGDDANNDDVALLVGRLTATEERPRQLTRRLPATPASAFLARRFAGQLLRDWGLDRAVVQTAELVISELVTNAARHSEDTLEVGLSCVAHVLRIEVGDTSHRMPAIRPPVEDPPDQATGGRGLVLVDALATRWGVESDGLGKRVWAEFDVVTANRDSDS